MRRLSLLFGLALCVHAQDAAPPLPVAIDPRFELLSVVQQLSDYGSTGLLNTDDTPYRRELLAWFNSYRTHPAVQSFSQAWKFGFSYDGPMFVMACLSAPPELSLVYPAESCGAERVGGAANLNFWLGQLRDFAAQSRYMEFYTAHREYYAELETHTAALLEANYGAQLESYFGWKQKSYQMFLTPLLRGNYGVRIPDGGTFATFAVIGAATRSTETYEFGTAAGLKGLLWHEFGHSFINPQVDANAGVLVASESLFAPIADKMKAQAYSNWLTTVKEHVVRAMVARQWSLNDSASAGELEVLAQRGVGFAYVPALVERLKEYEAGRESYATFADFMPRLVAVFDELSGQTFGPTFFASPYAGSINSVVTDRKRVLIIVPTAEADAAAQNLIRTTAVRLSEVLGLGTVIDDTEALSRDLSANALMVYGTLEGNLWLRQFQEKLPFTLRDGKLKIGAQEFSAPHLRLVFSMARPENDDLGMIVYTAPEAADIVAINSLTVGPTAWAVADGNTILKTGNYVRRDGAWVLPE